MQGQAIVSGIKTILQKSQTHAQAQLVNLTVPEDDIAAAFFGFLISDKNWTGYMGKKAHMIGTAHVAMTDTRARFIAWEAYVDITEAQTTRGARQRLAICGSDPADRSLRGTQGR